MYCGQGIEYRIIVNTITKISLIGASLVTSPAVNLVQSDEEAGYIYATL